MISLGGNTAIGQNGAALMNVSRGEIARRCLLLRCPNCDSGGQFRTWFLLQPACPRCGLKHGGEEGFTLGTTSIGYVVALLLVVLPVCGLVVMNVLSVWIAVLIGIVGSAAISIGLYPVFLGWVLMTYYVSTAEGLPINRPPTEKSPALPPTP
jgi:uncharacterized protein (DUF983 family)